MLDSSAKELKALSASRVKTLENCSWLYWCNYHLRLPQEKNEGAKKGDICHSIFELMVMKNRRSYFDKIVLHDSVTACPSIERLIKLYIKKCGLQGASEGFLHIDKMILVGLKNDFYIKGGKMVAPEYKFDFVNDNGTFRLKGLMDKPVIIGRRVMIDDYKSSKKKFSGEDQESNLQALFYSYAAKKLWPGLKPVVRFIFLQYPEDPLMEVSFSDDALLGFELYLEATQQKVSGFNESASKLNFAFDHPAVKDEFKGKSLCGFASFPGKLKRDGTKMWHCPYRFGYDYYAVEKDNKIVYCVFSLEEVRPLQQGETVKKCHYAGCPKHINPMDDLQTSISKSEPRKVYGNVLDDF